MGNSRPCLDSRPRYISGMLLWFFYQIFVGTLSWAKHELIRV